MEQRRVGQQAEPRGGGIPLTSEDRVLRGVWAYIRERHALKVARQSESSDARTADNGDAA